MPDLLAAALYYVDTMSWAVFPVHTPDSEGVCSCEAGPECESVGKHPRTQNGVYAATKDRGQIRDWWRMWPDANVGIATGEISGLVVVDIDPRNGGTDTVREFNREFGALPTDGVIAKTGGGGWHYFCSYETPTIYKPGSGIEIKSDGGYVVASPSLHVSGKRYQWRNRPRRDSEFPAPPAWALQSSSNGNSVRRQFQSASAVLNGVDEGSRDDEIFHLALTLLRLKVAYEQVEYLAVAAARECTPPLSDRVAMQKVRSAQKHLNEAPDVIPFSDLGNAERYVRNFGESVRWTQVLGWVVWTGQYWKRDTTKLHVQYAQRIGQIIRDEAIDRGLIEKELETANRAALNAESERGTNALLKQAEPMIAIDLHLFDRDPWQFNVQNGTIDLRTGKLLRHNRDHLITKIAPVTFDKHAEAPRFEQFLQETFLGDATLIAYMRRLWGYCLVGSSSEQVFPVLWGEGGNGKSKLVQNALGSVFGKDYMTKLPSNVVQRKHYSGQSQHYELMELRGARLAWCSESSARLDEETIKGLTGGDTIKARKMYKDLEEFDPTHTLVLITNNKPIASNGDAIWRRLQLLEFAYKVPADKIDVNLDKKLEAEASGILNWLLRGCLEWQEQGLNPPEKVIATTNAQREELDYVGQFLTEIVRFSAKATCSVNALYLAYSIWCTDIGTRPFGKITFTRSVMSRRTTVERYLSNGTRKLRGIGIKK